MTELSLYLDKRRGEVFFQEPGSYRDTVANVAYVIRGGRKVAEIKPQKGVIEAVPVKEGDRIVKVYKSNRGNVYIGVLEVTRDEEGKGLAWKELVRFANPPAALLEGLGLK
ncbi:MAG: hypothetical protein DRO39_07825, partial [Thermoprotei archaeon]